LAVFIKSDYGALFTGDIIDVIIIFELTGFQPSAVIKKNLGIRIAN
jgi:hypothetical protein